MKDLPSMSKLVDKLGSSTTTVYIQLYDLYRKQRKSQKHFHAGHYWVRMPYKDFPRMFPELSADAVAKAIVRLEDEGLLRMVHYKGLGWYVISRKRLNDLQETPACRPGNVIY